MIYRDVPSKAANAFLTYLDNKGVEYDFYNAESFVSGRYTAQPTNASIGLREWTPEILDFLRRLTSGF